MSYVNVFFNTKIVPINATADKLNKPCTAASVSCSIGDWFLTPARCLFNGRLVTLIPGNRLISKHEYYDETDLATLNQPKRNFIRIAIAVALIIPGLLLGTIFKGISYLSPSIRANHNLANAHLNPPVKKEEKPPVKLELPAKEAEVPSKKEEFKNDKEFENAVYGGISRKNTSDLNSIKKQAEVILPQLKEGQEYRYTHSNLTSNDFDTALRYLILTDKLAYTYSHRAGVYIVGFDINKAPDAFYTNTKEKILKSLNKTE